MLASINKSYLLIGGVIFLFFIPWVDTVLAPVCLINIFGFVLFFLVVNYSAKFRRFNNKHLLFIVASYSILFVVVFNLMSYSYVGNYFIFSDRDAATYHDYAREMAGMSLEQGIEYYLQFYGIDDLGMILILSTLYRFIESNLFYNLFNIIIGLITAFGIFKIGRSLMPIKYAFICALAFCLSSYQLWFHSSGLKESFMVMLTVLFYSQYIEYYHARKTKNIVLGLFVLLCFLFFRPALILIIMVSIGLGLFYDQVNGYRRALLISGLFILTFIGFSFIEQVILRFTAGSFELLFAAKDAQGMIIKSLPFTYSVNLLAQLIGPLPTIPPAPSSYLSLFSPGLIYRVLLAFPFWIGCFFAFKHKKRILYPIIFFVVIEMSSLTLILEGLELRKSMPHMPLVYITAFWFISYYKQIRKKSYIILLFNIYSVILIFIFIMWGFR